MKKWDLSDPEVKRWHDKLPLRSKLTADEYAKILSRYCRIMVP